MKPLKALILLIAALSILPAYGEDAGKDLAQHNNPRRYKREKQEKPPTACSMVEKKMDGQYGVKMPAHNGCPNNHDFFTQVDFLYMRAKNESLVYAHQNINNVAFGGPPNFLNVVNQGQMIRSERHWRPGFRVGLGWNTIFDHWDVFSNWTYYHNKNITNHAVPNIGLTSILSNVSEGLFPYWFAADDTLKNSSVAGTVKFQSLHGVWQLNYNTLKLELGRSLYLTKGLSLRPHFGIQNSWIHQKMRVDYKRSFSTPNEGLGSVNQEVTANNTSNFWGIGMCAGMDSSWELGGGFSVLGKVAGALLSARTNVRKIDSAITSGGEFFRVGNYRDRVEQIVPGLETGMGIAWGKCFSKDTLFLNFSLSWESMFWWQQFKFLKPKFGNSSTYQNTWNEYPSESETLIIEGISATARFDF